MRECCGSDPGDFDSGFFDAYGAPKFQEACMLNSLLGRRPSTHYREISVASAADMHHVIYWGEERCLPRMLVPTGLLVTAGGVCLRDPGHPLALAFAGNAGELAKFYDAFQPRNLRELHRIDGPGPGDDLPAHHLPWLVRDHRPPVAEGGLSASDGTSLYGPCTSAKIDYEIGRMTRLRGTIAKIGFRPDIYGDINGHFLRNGDQVAFFVRGGKHRAAALAALGHEEIPVVFRPHWPREIDLDQVDRFPGVQQGTISAIGVRELLMRYFKPGIPS